MRNAEKEQLPLLNIDRSPLFTGIVVTLSAVLGYFNYHLFAIMNPWAFILMIPAAVISFQSLWWLLNPFAELYDNRVEFKRSLFNEKVIYFTDIRNSSISTNGKLIITYHDDDMEAVNIFGINKSQLELLKSELDKSVKQGLKTA